MALINQVVFIGGILLLGGAVLFGLVRASRTVRSMGKGGPSAEERMRLLLDEMGVTPQVTSNQVASNQVTSNQVTSNQALLSLAVSALDESPEHGTSAGSPVAPGSSGSAVPGPDDFRDFFVGAAPAPGRPVAPAAVAEPVTPGSSGAIPAEATPVTAGGAEAFGQIVTEVARQLRVTAATLEALAVQSDGRYLDRVPEVVEAVSQVSRTVPVGDLLAAACAADHEA